jgi:hypothetical protein
LNPPAAGPVVVAARDNTGLRNAPESADSPSLLARIRLEPIAGALGTSLAAIQRKSVDIASYAGQRLVLHIHLILNYAGFGNMSNLSHSNLAPPRGYSDMAPKKYLAGRVLTSFVFLILAVLQPSTQHSLGSSEGEHESTTATDPSPTAFLVVDISLSEEGDVSLTWSNLGSNGAYTVEYCDSLAGASWFLLPPVRVLTAGCISQDSIAPISWLAIAELRVIQ